MLPSEEGSIDTGVNNILCTNITVLVTLHRTIVHKAEQHSHMKTAVLCGRSALKCHAELHQALGDCTLLYQTVARWVQTYKSVSVNWWHSTQYMFLVSLRHVSDQNWTVHGWSQMLDCERISWAFLCVCARAHMCKY
jgi:hypothetical protein